MTQVTPPPRKVQLRTRQFKRLSEARGLPKQQVRQAEILGISEGYFGRILAGHRVSGTVIANVLDLWPDVRFEDLFEVADEAEMADA